MGQFFISMIFVPTFCRKAFPILFLAVVVLPQVLRAQSIKTDLSQMKQNYLATTNINITAVSSFYRNDMVVSTQSTLFRKRGNSFLQKTDDADFLISDSSQLMIRDLDKKLTYLKLTRKDYEAAISNFFINDYDHLINSADSILFKGTANGQKKYIVYNSKKYVNSAELIFNSTNSNLISITYFFPMYKENSSKRQVVYTYASIAKIPTGEKTTESSYIIRNADLSVKPSTLYTNYTLLKVN
jgi:hypothetical protein